MPSPQPPWLERRALPDHRCTLWSSCSLVYPRIYSASTEEEEEAGRGDTVVPVLTEEEEEEEDPAV